MRGVILPAMLFMGVGALIPAVLTLPPEFAQSLVISCALFLIISVWTGHAPKHDAIPYLKSSLLIRFLFAIMICEVMIYFYPLRDAVGYNTDGFRAMLMLKDGDLGGFLRAGFLGGGGTTFYKKMTGVMFLFLGPNEVTVRVINTTIAWAGLLLFFRAFSEGMGARQRKAFALLVFLTPSILFWTSIHGKDPWMCFGIGVFSWVAVRTLKRGIPNLPELLLAGVALAIIYFIRPHIDMLLAGSLLLTAMVARGGSGGTKRLIPFLVGALVFWFAYSTFLRWVGVEETGSIRAILETGYEHQETIIEAGGSSYSIPLWLRSFLIPMAPLMVYPRPLPFEARNVFALYTSVESLILFILLASGLLGLWRHARQKLREPAVVFSLFYLLAFSLMFVFSGNYGLVARQKAGQALPLLCFIASFAFVNEKGKPHENP